MGFLSFLGERFRYKLTHSRKFPKGDLISFLHGIRKRGFSPACIVDIGANCGKWSRKAAQVFPDAEYLLVEPQSEMAPHLDRFCQSQKQARWINAGVSDQTGVLPFTVVPDTVSSSFSIGEREARNSGFERREVPVTHLDQLVLDELGTIPDLVKIDAEGFESRIMQGASMLHGKTEVFLLEVPLIDPPNSEWSSFLELGNLMSELGYEIYDFTSFQRRPLDGATGLCEIAFARRGGLLRKDPRWSAPVAKAA